MVWAPPIKNLGYDYESNYDFTPLKQLCSSRKSFFCVLHLILGRKQLIRPWKLRFFGIHLNFGRKKGLQTMNIFCFWSSSKFSGKNSTHFAQSWTALFRTFSFRQQPSASLTKGISLVNKPLGQTGQTLIACTAAEAFLFEIIWKAIAPPKKILVAPQKFRSSYVLASSMCEKIIADRITLTAQPKINKLKRAFKSSFPLLAKRLE